MDSVCEKLNNKKVYYTPKELSKLLKVSYRTILDLIHMGKLSAFRVGKLYLISECNLLKYENENNVTIFDYK